jgi:hypothetical protein
MLLPQRATFQPSSRQLLFDLAQYTRFKAADLLVPRAQESDGLLLQVCLFGPKSYNNGRKECIRVGSTKLLYFGMLIQSSC